jgi:SEC-C motif domain protein
METDCPCGSGMTYVACCGPLHSGTVTAPTAVELMRSRYSAFAVCDADYLLETWHTATRPASVDLDPAVEWRRLQIRGQTGGTEDDEAGTVEFIAHYWDAGRSQYGRHHENSRFARQGPRWLYVEPVL